MAINSSNQFWDKPSCCAPWDYIYSLLRPICLQLCMLLSNYCQQLANAWHKAKVVYIHADALAAHKQCDIAAVDRTTCLSKCLQVTVTCEDNLITPCISNFCRWDLSFHIISSLSLLPLLTDIVKTVSRNFSIFIGSNLLFMQIQPRVLISVTILVPGLLIYM